MSVHITSHRGGFGSGLTEITRIEEEEHATGIALQVLRLARGEAHEEVTPGEAAFLLMEGEMIVEVAGERLARTRRSLFDEGPFAVHVSAGERVAFRAGEGGAELTVYRTANTRRFAASVHEPSSVADEPRGKGQVADTALRIVRTIFDGRNASPEAELVLGEVVTLPGRWSSYPPHHHPQPEIYHYRFTDPRGFGHAELGEQVVKVRHNDTIKILAGVDHPQCAAPGYGMYYAWVIRHLPDARYGVPEFTPDHTWVMQRDAPVWSPKKPL